jgi:hypothetical protein
MSEGTGDGEPDDRVMFQNRPFGWGLGMKTCHNPLVLAFLSLIFLLMFVSQSRMVMADGFPVSRVKNTKKTERKSLDCGKLRVEWFNRTADAVLPGEFTLIVTGEGGVEILRVVEEAWMPPALEVLWCRDILGNGIPALTYTTFSGGARCCWDVKVVLLETPPRWLLRRNLGNFSNLVPRQLDQGGPLELVTKSDIFFGLADLPSFAAPFLPLVFSYDGEIYTEATRRFPDHIRADLETALLDLSEGSFVERTGKALRVLGDYVLLGEIEQGLADLRARVSGDVSLWLDKHASEAITRLNERF